MGDRLVFMGSDEIALPALEAIRAGNCGPIDLVAVYTQPDRPRGRGKKVQPNAIKTWAQGAGISVFQPEKAGKATRLEIAAMEPDAILVLAYGHLLSQALIDTPKMGIWNLHTSILPKYRGASPIQGAIVSGDESTGVTLMRMEREMDAGPTLDVEEVDIEELDTALSVEAKLAAACVPLLERNLPSVLRGEAEVVAQEASKASYVRKLGKDDGALDFRAPASVVARRVNGLFPWPGVRFSYGGVELKVGLATGNDEGPSGKAGEVLEAGANGLRVACGRGSVLLKRLQKPGGKMLETEAFLRGFELPVGAVLPSSEMPELVRCAPFRA